MLFTLRISTLCLFGLITGAVGESCYECSSSGSGQKFCDATVEADTSTTVCEIDSCRIQLQSLGGRLSYSRMCNPSEECTNEHIMNGDDFIISQCCRGHTCNGNVGGKTIECYTCSPDEEDCTRSVSDDDLLVSCPGQCYSSSKFIEATGKEVYERGCSLLSCPRETTTKTKTAAECCDSNKCNREIIPKPSTRPPPSSQANHNAISFVLFAFGFVFANSFIDYLIQ